MKIYARFYRRRFAVSFKKVSAASLIWLLSISLVFQGCGTGFNEPATKKNLESEAQKDYNYFFKVIIPEDIARSMTKEEDGNVAMAIERMGSIISAPLLEGKGESRNADEETTLMPAAGTAALLISEELRETVSELMDKKITIQFSHEELLSDNKATLADSAEERAIGTVEKVRVFVYNGKNNPMDTNAWEIKILDLSISAGDTKREVVESAPIEATQEGLQVNNNEVVQDYIGNTVALVAVSPSVVTEQRNENTLVFTTAGSEVIAEADRSVSINDITGQEKRIHKKIKRAWNKVIGNQIRNEWRQNRVAVGRVVLYTFAGLGLLVLVFGLTGTDARSCGEGLSC